MLATAHGNLDELYPLPELRGATLLHLVGGSVRARLPDNVVELSRLLLAAGADPNAQTDEGATVLDIIMLSRQITWMGVRTEMFELLLDAGARGGPKLMWQALISSRGNIFRNPPDAEHYDFARMLHARGVPIDLPFAAALGLREEMQTFFAEDGSLLAAANTLYRPGPGRTASDQDVLDIALAYAAFGGQRSAVDDLLARGANINSRVVSLREGRSTNTALHKAVIVNNLAMLRHLLMRGADPLVGSEHGSLPIDYARYGPYEDLEQVLEEAMATEP